MRERVKPGAPRRECIVCGTMFKIPLNKHTRNGKPHWEYSRRKTCGATCRNITASNAMEDKHERARNGDPEEYRAWLARDYAAMGRKRWGNK